MNPPTFCQPRRANFYTLGAIVVVVVWGFQRRGGLGNPAGPVVGVVSDHIHAYALAANQTLDVVVVESMVGANRDRGGVVDTSTRDFDIVSIFRVQTCHGRVCVTYSLDDYRYEGTIFDTNASSWYPTLRFLGLVGQVYNLVRLACLFVGAARPAGVSRLVASGQATRRCSSIVIYGSWISVLVFAVAHAIDATVAHTFTDTKWKTILGHMDVSYTEVLWILACHMRNVWDLSLVGKLILATHSRTSLAQRGFPGVRGYLLVIISFLLQVHRVPSSPHLSLLRATHPLSYENSNSGLGLEMKNLFFAGVVILPVSCPSNPQIGLAWLWTRRPLRVEAVASPPCNSTKTRRAVHTLINLAWMTHPFLYLYVRWHDPLVYTYEDGDGHQRYHPLPPKLRALWTDIDDPDANVDKQRLLGLPWRRRLDVE
ncbi:Aste57867_11855 [Aphanomyces stellatus]|uniref:Aste57867_11855 protein n=1 Tax=Aphanomyces stellatus TaxID=120398 RepID=A0A485KUK1_9STRA|nr:hypothetical protein As57867_011810 [Aphanomyces stellatus]VFT88710.1 Aste57867_11855 [Aphanomyces stellatus]